MKTGVMLPKAKERPKPRERLGTDLFLASSEGAWPADTLISDF